MMDNNYFLGIDLGTTNSVLSYINVKDDGEIRANIVEVPRISDTGRPATRGCRLSSIIRKTAMVRSSRLSAISPRRSTANARGSSSNPSSLRWGRIVSRT